MSIGKNIKSLRESRGLTQDELGKIIGVSGKTVSSWELETKTPRMGALQSLADFFQIKKSDIIEDDTNNIEADLYKTLSELCSQKGITAYRMCKDVGIQPSIMTDLKKGRRSSVKVETAQRIADYFEVSVAELLGNENIKTPGMPKNAYPVEDGDFVMMPILASVRAGYDGQAITEYSDEILPVADMAFKGYPKEECVVMRVSGDSMYPKLLDGDYVLVHTQTSVDSGSLAIVIYNGDEATIKQVRYISGEDWVELIPANPEFKPKRIEGADLEQCRIFGLVLGLIYRDM